MEVYLGDKQDQKLLRTYLLKNCYEVAKGLDKEVASSLVSSCLIIRMRKIRNQTEFGYKEELKTGVLKKIHFVYLADAKDLITFLWTHAVSEKPLAAAIFIDSVDQYFGERFNYNEGGVNINTVVSLLTKLGEKALTKKMRVKVGMSFAYNPYIFPKQQFLNYMGAIGVNVWEVSSREFLKNGYGFENEAIKRFLETYGPPNLKQQPEY